MMDRQDLLYLVELVDEDIRRERRKLKRLPDGWEERPTTFLVSAMQLRVKLNTRIEQMERTG